MGEWQKHMLQSPDTRFNYLSFDSLTDFHAFVDREATQLTPDNDQTWHYMVQSAQNRINRGTDWYGKPAPSSLDELNGHLRFMGMALLQALQPRIREHLAAALAYLEQEVMPKPRADYNDRGLGLFSFDRAAMGLFRLAAVDTSTPLNTTVSQLGIELGRTGLQTQVKKVYAFFDHKDRSYPSMRLYLLAGANANVKGDEMLYVGLACSELVDFLEARGVSVEVNVLLGTAFLKQVSIAVIRVKRFQDTLDKNQLLLVSSDPRYFRFRGFKAIVALANYFGLTVPIGLGRIYPDMGTGFVKALGGNGFVFGQSYSLDAAAREVIRIIENFKKNRNNGTKAA